MYYKKGWQLRRQSSRAAEVSAFLRIILTADMWQADWRSDRWASSCITGRTWRGALCQVLFSYGRIDLSSSLLTTHLTHKSRLLSSFPLLPHVLTFINTATMALFVSAEQDIIPATMGPFDSQYKCKSCHIQWDVCMEDAEGLRTLIHSLFSKVTKIHTSQRVTSHTVIALPLWADLMWALDYGAPLSHESE